MTWTALADISRDIAGKLPPHALERWSDPGARTPQLASLILAPFAITGTVVASDTAGLSRMASRLPLATVLKRIAEPKKHIHRLGTALGGRAIGCWVADNTEMFYPSDVHLSQIVHAMLSVHDLTPTRVGFGIHQGTFYQLGAGLYGPDSDRVEILAEDHSSGGDTLITDTVQQQLDDTFSITPRPHSILGATFSVQGAGIDIPGGSPHYPIPYDHKMHQLLEQLDEAEPTPVLRAIKDTYQDERFILLVYRHEQRPTTSLIETVTSLLLDLRFEQLALSIIGPSTSEFSIGGNLALAAFTDLNRALSIAHTLRTNATEAGYTLNIGVDAGPVYRFPMGDGHTEFAGDAVNRSSKMAEDLALPGRISVTRRASPTSPAPSAAAISWEISGIQIRAWEM